MSAVNGSGTNLTNDVLIRNNSAFAGFNKPANITLYNIGNRGFSSPTILDDVVNCTGCSNFSSLTAANVVFNVSSMGRTGVRNA